MKGVAVLADRRFGITCTVGPDHCLATRAVLAAVLLVFVRGPHEACLLFLPLPFRLSLLLPSRTELALSAPIFLTEVVLTVLIFLIELIFTVLICFLNSFLLF